MSQEGNIEVGVGTMLRLDDGVYLIKEIDDGKLTYMTAHDGKHTTESFPVFQNRLYESSVVRTICEGSWEAYHNFDSDSRDFAARHA